MDLNLNYSDDENPLSLKSDLFLSLWELIVGSKEGLQPVEKTIIDRCVRLVYQAYLNDPKPENMPILEDLYNALREQDEKKAQYIATALEIYVTGSLNVFNHRTNVDIQRRIVSYDIKELGKQLKKIGMLIVQDQVWNRVTVNCEAHKSTRYYIDEMHLLLKEEQTAAYTVEIWKRFRKWGGIPTGIMQNVKDLLSSREVEIIFENSDYMLNQASGDRQIQTVKKDHFVGSFFDADEVNKLFEVSKGTKLELPILFGAFYGLRRSEAIGLKWDAIDFENETIIIRHTVTSVNIDSKRVLVAADTTKTKSSMRTLPLVPFVKERLLAVKSEQENNKRLCGKSYNKKYAGYVCINEIGDLIKPHYVTEQFPKLLEANGMRHIRFHDLRHSCASLMLANGVPMKQIQEWLGHSDFSTTANIYAHLDYSSKLNSADAMLSGLGIAEAK